jgi:predicted alpha/beta hydrolase
MHYFSVTVEQSQPRVLLGRGPKTVVTLWRRWENQEDKLGLTTQLLQGLYTTADESLPISTVSTYDSCADMS